MLWQDYYTVTSVPEALQLLAQYGERARVVAGGTDIIIELERHARPGVDVLIDISRIPALDAITRTDDGQVHLGALVTHNQVVSQAERVGWPLAQASWEVGAPQIRNRATVAGNVITASPANDTITPLFALDAIITLESAARGTREVPIQEFYTGYRATVMQPDELLTGIQYNAQFDAGIFLKLGLRRAQAISVVNVAIVLDFADGRHSPISSAAIALGCVAATIIRLPAVEDFLPGKSLTEENIHAAANMAASIPQPIDDVRSTADYRSEMIRVYVSRALRALRDGTEADAWPQNPAMLWSNDPQATVEAAHHTHGSEISTVVNGQAYQVSGGANKTLLRFLREDLKLTGTKEGCAEGECGACTVFIDDTAVMACMVPAPCAHHATIATVEGLTAPNGDLHPIQRGFVQAGAVQCGFCTPGFLMSGAKLLQEAPRPTRAQIEQSISGNLCRCTGYYKIIEAFELAQEESDG